MNDYSNSHSCMQHRTRLLVVIESATVKHGQSDCDLSTIYSYNQVIQTFGFLWQVFIKIVNEARKIMGIFTSSNSLIWFVASTAPIVVIFTICVLKSLDKIVTFSSLEFIFEGFLWNFKLVFDLALEISDSMCFVKVRIKTWHSKTQLWDYIKIFCHAVHLWRHREMVTPKVNIKISNLQSEPKTRLNNFKRKEIMNGAWILFSFRRETHRPTAVWTFQFRSQYHIPKTKNYYPPTGCLFDPRSR